MFLRKAFAAPLRRGLAAGLLGAAFCAPAFGQYEIQPLSPFKGLYLTSGASTIDPAFATEAQNVWYLREGGMQTRPGFALVNSTSLGAETPWLLGRFHRPGQQPAFIVGHGPYLWKLGAAGGFNNPDSIIAYRVGTVTQNTDSVRVVGTGTKFLNSIQVDDTLLIGAIRRKVLRVKWDSLLWVDATPGVGLSGQPTQILPIFENSTYGTIVQVNNQIIAGSERRGAIIFSENEVPTLLGLVFQGTVDSIGTAPNNNGFWDHGVSLTANEFSGYAVLVAGLNASGNPVSSLHKILSNTSVQVVTQDGFSGGDDPLTTGSYTNLHYFIYAPFFTVIDSGTVRAVHSTATEVTDLLQANEDTLRWKSQLVEFYSGKLAGQQFNLASVTKKTGTPDSIKLNIRNTTTLVVRDNLSVGDKFYILSAGASARHWLWYNQQLVGANSDFFPNQMRFSEPGTLHDFAPLNFRVVSEKTGSQITGVRDFNGELALWQEGDTWKMPGADLSSAQLIHALSGVGCPAQRSLAISGSTAFWLTIQSGMPKVVSWGGGGVKFNVVGDPSVYAGGDLADISRPIVPLMKGLNLANVSKAAGGFWEDHYLLSVPESSSTVPSHTYCYHIPSGRWARANFAGSIFHNATSAPDSGQLYFGNRHIGKINRFGGVETDTGSNISMAYQTGDFTFGSSNTVKQLGSVELDYEKANTDSIALQVYKNLPAALINGYGLASGLTGYRTLRRGFGGVVGKSLRFRLSYAAATGIKFHAFRFTYLPIGVP